MYGMSPQTDRQGAKAGRQSTQREKQRGQRELKGEDNELSSAWDLVYGLSQMGIVQCLALLRWKSRWRAEECKRENSGEKEGKRWGG